MFFMTRIQKSKISAFASMCIYIIHNRVYKQELTLFSYKPSLYLDLGLQLSIAEHFQITMLFATRVLFKLAGYVIFC